MKRVVVLIFLFWCCIGFANEHNVLVSGNKRTRTAYVQELYKMCVRKKESQDSEVLEQCLMNSQIFTKVEIEKKQGKTFVKIEERWTLIPLPFFKGEREGKTYGLFAVERNFLGMGKLMVGGGTFGDNSASGFLMYNDPFLFYSDYYANIKLNINKEDFYRYSGEQRIDGYTAKTKEISPSIGKHFGHFSIGVELELKKQEYDRLDGFDFLPANHKTVKGGVSLRYKNADFKFYFNEGLISRTNLWTDLVQKDGGKKSQSLVQYLSWQKNLFADHALQLRGLLHLLKDGGQEDIVHLGGNPGYRGVAEMGIWSKRGASIAIDYQVPVWTASYGTWTVAPFAEYGHFERFDSEGPDDDSLAAGVGGYLFLKKVALPGLGLVAGHNPNFEENFVTFFVGVGH